MGSDGDGAITCGEWERSGESGERNDWLVLVLRWMKRGYSNFGLGCTGISKVVHDIMLLSVYIVAKISF